MKVPIAVSIAISEAFVAVIASSQNVSHGLSMHPCIIRTISLIYTNMYPAT